VDGVRPNLVNDLDVDLRRRTGETNRKERKGCNPRRKSETIDAANERSSQHQLVRPILFRSPFFSEQVYCVEEQNGTTYVTDRRRVRGSQSTSTCLVQELALIPLSTPLRCVEKYARGFILLREFLFPASLNMTIRVGNVTIPRPVCTLLA